MEIPIEDLEQVGNEEIVRSIFVNVYHGVGRHGNFLVKFSDAYLYADSENKELLKEVAIKLIEKYKLNNTTYTIGGVI